MPELRNPHNAEQNSGGRGKTDGQRHKHLFWTRVAADKVGIFRPRGKIDTSGIAIAPP
jgi:hypothetical protein